MNIETQLKQLRLEGTASNWQAIVDNRKHHELTFIEGMDMLQHIEADDRSDKEFGRLSLCLVLNKPYRVNN